MIREEPMMREELPEFETLRRLAESDPERLEQLRHRLTERLITNAPERSQRRLRGLQFQIEARLRIAPNPVAACIAVSSMMHETLEHLHHALTDWPRPQPERRNAKVLSFRQTQPQP